MNYFLVGKYSGVKKYNARLESLKNGDCKAPLEKVIKYNARLERGTFT